MGGWQVRKGQGWFWRRERTPAFPKSKVREGCADGIVSKKAPTFWENYEVLPFAEGVQAGGFLTFIDNKNFRMILRGK